MISLDKPHLNGALVVLLLQPLKKPFHMGIPDGSILVVESWEHTKDGAVVTFIRSKKHTFKPWQTGLSHYYSEQVLVREEFFFPVHTLNHLFILGRL